MCCHADQTRLPWRALNLSMMFFIPVYLHSSWAASSENGLGCKNSTPLELLKMMQRAWKGMKKDDLQADNFYVCSLCFCVFSSLTSLQESSYHSFLLFLPPNQTSICDRPYWNRAYRHPGPEQWQLCGRPNKQWLVCVSLSGWACPTDNCTALHEMLSLN